MFKNEATPEVKKSWDGKELPNYYGFTMASKYLFLWSRTFQAVVSQSATFMLTGEFHEQDCGIYKAEGGSKVVGVGELVVYDDHCRFDYCVGNLDKQTKQCADLITHIVLNWNPNNPIYSMIKAAADFIKVEFDVLNDVIEKASVGGAFGGNALADFFNWNPFSDAPENREYEQFCLVEYGDKNESEVVQMFADRDLGKALHKNLREKVASNKTNGYASVLCCSPRRDDKNDLKFWINTGRSTNIDGWKSEEDINNFLNGDGKVVDGR